jgi:hypothetical protein
MTLLVCVTLTITLIYTRKYWRKQPGVASEYAEIVNGEYRAVKDAFKAANSEAAEETDPVKVRAARERANALGGDLQKVHLRLNAATFQVTFNPSLWWAGVLVTGLLWTTVL